MPPSKQQKQKEAVSSSRATRSTTSKLPNHEFLFLENSLRRKSNRGKATASTQSVHDEPSTQKQSVSQKTKIKKEEDGFENEKSVTRLTTNALENTYQQLQRLKQQLNDCKLDNNILLERVNLLQNTVVDLYNERNANRGQSAEFEY